MTGFQARFALSFGDSDLSVNQRNKDEPTER